MEHTQAKRVMGLALALLVSVAIVATAFLVGGAHAPRLSFFGYQDQEGTTQAEFYRLSGELSATVNARDRVIANRDQYRFLLKMLEGDNVVAESIEMVKGFIKRSDPNGEVYNDNLDAYDELDRFLFYEELNNSEFWQKQSDDQRSPRRPYLLLVVPDP